MRFARISSSLSPERRIRSSVSLSSRSACSERVSSLCGRARLTKLRTFAKRSPGARDIAVLLIYLVAAYHFRLRGELLRSLPPRG